MIRGERLIKLGDSWFSAKSMEVEMFIFFPKGSVIFLKKFIYLFFFLKNLPIFGKRINKQSAGAKVHGREGNSPDRLLKFLSFTK